jgi:hypothetical protein
MTDWTGGPDPEHERELEDPEPEEDVPDYIKKQGLEFYWNRKVGNRAPERPEAP